jgi:hypothetical protein
MFSPQQVEKLLSQQSISDRKPWSSNDPVAVEEYYKNVCADLMTRTGTSSKIEWNHYGSGYASFIDVWIYKPTENFSVNYPGKRGEAYEGLCILLSRLSPYYVFLQGSKSWEAQGGSSYLPAYEALDNLTHTSIITLGVDVQEILTSQGLVRVFKSELSLPIDSSIRVPTILSDGPFVEFDALFYWED